MEWEGWAVLLVMLLALVLLYSEFRPPDVVLLGALTAVWCLGIIETKDAIAGFSNSSLITVGSLFIVVEGVDKAKVVDKVARKCLGKQTSEFMALLRLCSLGLSFSGFFNNTPLVALLMPILRDWARGRNFAPSKFLIPLSYSTIGGGLMTIIGTSTNLVILGMMEKSPPNLHAHTGASPPPAGEAAGGEPAIVEAGGGDEETFGFFDPAKVGGPVSLFALFYLLTVGRRLLPDNRGGMFREVAERTADWLTELHVTEDFPLVGTNLWEVIAYLGIPKESVKKIFRIRKETNEQREWKRKNTIDASLALTPSEKLRAHPNNDECPDTVVSLDDLECSMPRSMPRQLSPALPNGSCTTSPLSVSFTITPPEMSVRDVMRGQTTDNSNMLSIPGDVSAPSKPSRRKHYRTRTLGFFNKSTTRMMTLDLEQVAKSVAGDLASEESKSASPTTERSKALSAGASSCTSFADMDDDAIIEIGPLSEHQHGHLVLQGGDTLVLNLPIKTCMKLFQSREIWNRLKDLDVQNEAATPASNNTVLTEKLRGSLRIQNVNFLDLPGWTDEFVELVLSAKNPFVGKVFNWKERQSFESYYQGAVIAVRRTGERQMVAGDTERSISGVLRSKLTKKTWQTEEGLASSVSFARYRSEGQKLRPGDTVLVLAQSGEKSDRLQVGQDFLTVTRVGHERKGGANPLDYVPLVLFIAGLAMVAVQVIPMVQASIALAVIFIFGGWVEAKRIRECVDWNLMILIGSALGLSAAVRESGLSAGVASIVKSANLGPWGSVYLLYFFVMLITELVTNNAAAALGYPLAVDLAREMGLKSAKPLIMTVMLAASTSYASPIGYATNLMVLGPGGYSFTDFLKVGLPMDIIYWLGCSTFLPVVWPLEKLGD